MYRRGVIVDKLQRGRDTVQAPFYGLLAETLPLDAPAQGCQSLGKNVDDALGLDNVVDLDDAWMANSS